jgi:DNA-nicking Smr family endonuclease
MTYYFPKPARYGEPDATLDLHGLTGAEARRALENVLADYVAGAHVRVIVGKGRNSETEPVLPRVVKAYLDEHSIEYHPAHPRDGGEGALEVFL